MQPRATRLSAFLVAGWALCACGDDAPIAATPTTDRGLPPSMSMARPDVTCMVGGTAGGAAAETSRELSAPIVRAEVPPPPISGGTLFATRDGTKLVAADPDRDAIYVIDVAQRSLERKLTLNPGDEPGRVAQDGAGRIHVALRGGHGLVSFTLGSTSEPRRSEICDLPRGLAYDAKRDRLYVACAEGTLLSLEPATGVPRMKLDLGRDLRDVIVRDDGLYVTRFRSAEVVRVDPDTGRTTETRTLPDTTTSLVAGVTSASGTCTPTPVVTGPSVTSSPDVAWRTLDLPGRGVAVLHQRAQLAPVQTAPGGYGSSTACGTGIVRSSITISTGDVLDTASVDLDTPGLFVDMAIDPSASLIAIADPGSWGTQTGGVQLFPVPTDASVGMLMHFVDPCLSPQWAEPVDGQVTAVTFLTPTTLVVQTREPATIVFKDLTNVATPPVVSFVLDLKQPSRADTGHTLFHVTAGAGMACASCHPEAGDDGHLWTFSGIGPRRTQNLRGGILGTEPFHWNGDLKDFPMLVGEVFVKRMNGPSLDAERASALAQWIDAQPALHATASDTAAIERGKTMFESDELGCATCHSGAHQTNNQSAFVGTGAVLQVPSLVGLSFRAPFMHDGCAPTLSDRFDTTCGGGERHGHTAQVSDDGMRDLTAYLESL